MKAVYEIMSAGSLCCRNDERIEVVKTRMSDFDVNFLPVVDEHKKVVGSIRSLDICRAAHKTKKPKEQILVSEVMTYAAIAVNTHDDEAQALMMLRTNHAKSLPVVDYENTLRGSVSFVAIARKIVLLKNEFRALSQRAKRTKQLT